MIKRTLSAFLFAIIFASAFSQDSIPRTNTRYVGIQANQLIRQILNFSNSSSAVVNPYLLTYSVNSNATGWGANFGWGFNYNEFKDGDAFNERKTTISDLSFRIGFEKKSKFGKHWIFSGGVDAVIDALSNTTTTKTNGNSSVKTKNTTTGFGLGPRFTLNYDVSDKIMVGTEVTYYFKSLKTKTKVSGDFSQPDEEENLTRFQLNLPAVIFLILKF